MALSLQSRRLTPSAAPRLRVQLGAAREKEILVDLLVNERVREAIPRTTGRGASGHAGRAHSARARHDGR
jgi:hypothetical protein